MSKVPKAIHQKNCLKFFFLYGFMISATFNLQFSLWGTTKLNPEKIILLWLLLGK